MVYQILCDEVVYWCGIVFWVLYVLVVASVLWVCPFMCFICFTCCSCASGVLLSSGPHMCELLRLCAMGLCWCYGRCVFYWLYWFMGVFGFY